MQRSVGKPVPPVAPDVVVRGALHSDVEAVAGLWRQLFSLHAELDPVFTPAEDGHVHYRRWVRYHLDRPDSIVVVSEVAEEVVGYVLAIIQTLPPVLRYQRIGLISDAAVDERHRNLTIGRQLVAEVERRLQDRGVQRIELKSASANSQANHFWQEVCGYMEFAKVRAKIFDNGKDHESS